MGKTLAETCENCGANLKRYDVFDGAGNVVGDHDVCPNQWRQSHS